MKEIFHLLWLNLLVTIREVLEYFKVVTRYYYPVSFWKIDLSLLKSYLFKSPYAISKAFLKKRGEKEIYAYGETPLTTLDIIGKELDLKEKDILFELGCGRGRGCFFLSSRFKCRVVGIDFVPPFIQKANHVKEKFHLNRVEFRLQDFLQADLTGATVIYLYGTTLDEPTIKKLLKKFEKLPSKTKFITVSYPLSDYAKKGSYKTLKTMPLPFTWGIADVYLQVKNS